MLKKKSIFLSYLVSFSWAFDFLASDSKWCGFLSLGHVVSQALTGSYIEVTDGTSHC